MRLSNTEEAAAAAADDDEDDHDDGNAGVELQSLGPGIVGTQCFAAGNRKISSVAESAWHEMAGETRANLQNQIVEGEIAWVVENHRRQKGRRFWKTKKKEARREWRRKDAVEWKQRIDPGLSCGAGGSGFS